MATVIDDSFREQLLERRTRLQTTASVSGDDAELRRLLEEVDAALARMDNGSYGLCEACHDPIEADRLIADPLVRVCRGGLTGQQQEAVEEDLGVAIRIQRDRAAPLHS